jgi:hypothetical protein
VTIACPHCHERFDPPVFINHIKTCTPRKAETDEERDARECADADLPETRTRYEQSLLNQGDAKGAAAAVKQRLEWAARKAASR